MEKTFIMIKPDGVKKRLIEEVVSRIEKKGFTINQAKLFQPSKDVVKEHYIEHEARHFYGELVDYISNGKVFAMEVEGENVIEVMRLMIGNKDPKLASPGTLRGDFAFTIGENIIHGSDSKESADRELALWFK